MGRSILLAFAFVRKRLGRLLILAGVLVAASLGGANLWAWHHFRAAEKALRDEQVEEAQQHVSRCLRVWRLSSETHLLAARVARVAGRYPDAERHLLECKRLRHGTREDAQLEEILLRAQSGEIRQVENGLWQCVYKDDPQSTRILETLARVYLAEHRSASALHALTRWLERDPRAARAWHWRGWLYERLERPEKAIPDYEKAVEVDPSRWGSRLRLARLLLGRNHSDAVRVHLQELMRSHGDDPDVQVVHAQALMLEVKDEESIRLLDRVLKDHPNCFEALYLRSRLACQQDPPRYAEGEGFLRRALVERPLDLRVLHLFAQCLQQQGKTKEAAEVQAKRARIAQDAKRLADLTQFQVEHSPYDPNLLLEIGELLLNLGDEESGLRWIERALRQDPTHQRSHEILVHYYQSRGRTAEAERHRRYLARLAAPSPASPETPR